MARQETEHSVNTAGITSDGDSRLLLGLLNLLPSMAAYWDSNHRNVVANSAFVDWFGISPQQMRGMLIPDVIGETVYQLNRPYIEAAYAGEVQHFDRTLVKHTGETRHTQFTYVPDVIDGKVCGIFTMVTDVTPRVEAELVAHQAERLGHLGSWSWDLESGEMVWSDETYRIFGVDPESFVPRRSLVLQLIHPDDIDTAMSHAADARVHSKDYNHRFRIIRPDGTIRYIESHGRIAEVKDGRTVRMAGTYQDITEIDSTARELERINRLNSDVIGMLGHDVRAPLTVILGYLEELDENWGSLDDPTRHTLVGRVRGSAKRASRLVNDILTLAAAQSGVIRPSAKDVRIDHLLTETLADLPGGGDIVVDVQDADTWLHVDPFHLRQIIANLVSNAVRYGASPIAIRASTADDRVLLVVSDHGPGVPADVVPHLFDRFSATGSQQNVHRGTGLGLYLIDQLVRANGGSVAYQPPSDGRPTSFEIRLPRR